MKSTKSKKANIWIAGILLLIILSILGFLGIFGDIVTYVSWPFQTVFQAVSRGINSFEDRQLSEENAAARIQELEAEVRNLAVDYVELNTLREENEMLKKQLDYLETTDYSVVAAKVLTYQNSPNEKILIINKGEDHGIGEGYPVMSGEGMIVGRVSKTQNKIAEVRLITDPRSKVPVKLLGEDKTIGIASGSYSSILKLELIPAQEKIKVNDLVVTSNLEPNIPPDLIVGLINEIHISGNEPFKSALVEPSANFNNIRTVSIIIPIDG